MALSIEKIREGVKAHPAWASDMDSKMALATFLVGQTEAVKLKKNKRLTAFLTDVTAQLEGAAAPPAAPPAAPQQTTAIVVRATDAPQVKAPRVSKVQAPVNPERTYTHADLDRILEMCAVMVTRSGDSYILPDGRKFTGYLAAMERVYTPELDGPLDPATGEPPYIFWLGTSTKRPGWNCRIAILWCWRAQRFAADRGIAFPKQLIWAEREFEPFFRQIVTICDAARATLPPR